MSGSTISIVELIQKFRNEYEDVTSVLYCLAKEVRDNNQHALAYTLTSLNDRLSKADDILDTICVATKMNIEALKKLYEEKENAK